MQNRLASAWTVLKSIRRPGSGTQVAPRPSLRATDLVEREKQVRTFVEEVWNGRNYEAADDLYGETYVNRSGQDRRRGSNPSVATGRRSPTSTSKSRS